MGLWVSRKIRKYARFARMGLPRDRFDGFWILGIRKISRISRETIVRTVAKRLLERGFGCPGEGF